MWSTIPAVIGIINHKMFQGDLCDTSVLILFYNPAYVTGIAFILHPQADCGRKSMCLTLQRK